ERRPLRPGEADLGEEDLPHDAGAPGPRDERRLQGAVDEDREVAEEGHELEDAASDAVEGRDDHERAIIGRGTIAVAPSPLPACSWRDRRALPGPPSETSRRASSGSSRGPARRRARAARRGPRRSGRSGRA